MKKLFVIALLFSGCVNPESLRVDNGYLSYQNDKLLNIVQRQLEMLEALATLDNPVDVGTVRAVIDESKLVLMEMNTEAI